MRKLLVLASIVLCCAASGQSQYRGKTLIAHRGAAAYAPEHTLEAYRKALEQKADYVEQDLQVTRDGVLVCLHDLTLERTTKLPFANGLGPAKELVANDPDIVKRAHALGLSITPYTFRNGELDRFSSLSEQMAFFLQQLDVDALFTDNPDLFPRRK